MRESASARLEQHQANAWEPNGRRRCRTGAVGRLLVLFSVLLVGLLSIPVAALASCVGPELSYGGGQVRPGDAVHVVGQHWGDDCFDTGRPPAGQGALGLPRTGIVVLFEQGGTQTVVARGDADAEYRFQVDIVIPETAALGAARLMARAGDEVAFAAAGDPLVVASAGQGSPATVASFGPIETEVPLASPARAAPWWPVYIAVALMIVGAVLLGWRWRRGARSN